MNRGDASDRILSAAIPGPQKLILLGYLRHQGSDKAPEEGSSFPSVDLLCSYAGTGERTTSKHRQALIDAGILVPVKTRFCNVLECRVDFEALDAAGRAERGKSVAPGDRGGSRKDCGTAKTAEPQRLRKQIRKDCGSGSAKTADLDPQRLRENPLQEPSPRTLRSSSAPAVAVPTALVSLLRYGEDRWSWALADEPEVLAADVASMLPAGPPGFDIARSLGDCEAWLRGQAGKPGGWSTGAWLVKVRQWVQRDIDRHKSNIGHGIRAAAEANRGSGPPALRPLSGGLEVEGRALFASFVAAGSRVRPIRERLEREGGAEKWRLVCDALRDCALSEDALATLASAHDLDRKRREAAFVEAYCRRAKGAA